MTLTDFHPTHIRFLPADDHVLVEFAHPRMSEEENIELLGRELFLLVEQFGCRRVVVSLAGVEWITSAFIGKLITLHRKLHRRDGVVVICEMNDEITSVLRTSRLLDYFQTERDRDSALVLLRTHVSTNGGASEASGGC